MSKLDDMKNIVPQADKRKEIIDEIRKTLEPVPSSSPVKEQSIPKNSPVLAEKKPDTEFTSEDRKQIIKEKLQRYKDRGIKIKRRDKKIIENMEFDSTQKTRGTLIIIAIIGLMFIAFIRNMLPNEAMYTIIILMGMTMFFPLGMIAGWLFLDPVMRCKMLRRTTRKNYGLVWFVSKGQKAVSKIKDFDQGLIWKQKECWVLTKDKIVQMTKDGNTINEGKMIDPSSIITLVDTVPVIFVDMDSMEPLMLHQKDRVPVYPGEIGPSLKAWVDNQRAKMMGLHKAQDILMIIAVIAACGAVVVSFIVLNKVEEQGKIIITMAQQINQLVNPTPIPPMP